MRSFLRSVPLPLSGLTLGLAALANLYRLANWTTLASVTAILSTGLLLLLILKLVLTPLHACGSLTDPVVASVAPTFSMTLMILCTFFLGWGLPLEITRPLWLLAVAVHFGLMIFFAWYHLINAKKELRMVFPSWFVTFVGIGVIPVTSGKFWPAIGEPMVWITMICYAIVFPFVMYRLKKHALPEPALPIKTIVAAPMSLTLTAYISAMAKPDFAIATIIAVLAQLLYWGTLFAIKGHLSLPFYPSFGAFTFPVVITATGLTRYTSTFAANTPMETPLHWLLGIEWTIATLLVIFATLHYVKFLVRLAASVQTETGL